MKHAVLCTLAIASCLLAPPTHAQLQWLGPLPTATKPAAAPKAPPVPPRSARRQIDDDDALHSTQKGLPLELVIKDNQAKVCQLSANVTRVCAVIEAPLPPGTTVKLWNLPNGSIAVSYMRTPGVQGTPDPNGTAAVRFQAAFKGAARAVLTRTRSTTASGTVHKAASNVDMVCDNEDCVEGGGGGGGGGGGSSSGGGGGGGGGGGIDPSIPVVEVHGTPEPVGEIPTVTVVGHREESDPPELLPPLAPRDELASLTDPCVINPIMTVCIVGKRPPVLVDEPPLPTGNPPWFPQWACDFAHVLCTRGQIQTKPEDPPHNPLWPQEAEFGRCIKQANAHLEYCKMLFEKASHEQVEQCLKDVTSEIDDCYLLHGPNPNP